MFKSCHELKRAVSGLHMCLLGADGGLDFGTQRVSGENKSLTMQLRNRGKYEIGYQ